MALIIITCPPIPTTSFECPECSMVFRRYSGLKRHRDKAHT